MDVDISKCISDVTRPKTSPRAFLSKNRELWWCFHHLWWKKNKKTNERRTWALSSTLEVEKHSSAYLWRRTGTKQGAGWGTPESFRAEAPALPQHTAMCVHTCMYIHTTNGCVLWKWCVHRHKNPRAKLQSSRDTSGNYRTYTPNFLQIRKL